MANRITPLKPPKITLESLETAIKKKRWCLCSYLIVNVNLGDLVELGERELPEVFAREMATHVYDYIYNNKMPPPEIQQTVLNIAEDLGAGRKVQLRAGDYIATQQFFRGRA